MQKTLFVLYFRIPEILSQETLGTALANTLSLPILHTPTTTTILLHLGVLQPLDLHPVHLHLILTIQVKRVLPVSEVCTLHERQCLTLLQCSLAESLKSLLKVLLSSINIYAASHSQCVEREQNIGNFQQVLPSPGKYHNLNSLFVGFS